MSKFIGLVIVCSMVAFATPAAVSRLAPFFASGSGPRPSLLQATGPACDIKGNISIETGERIYHLPGQEYYAATKISPEYGERWFCSEDDARTAGWRRARR